MKARDVVGRKIVRIEHTRYETNGNRPITACVRIVLDNGAVLYPFTVECEDTTEAEICLQKKATT